MSNRDQASVKRSTRCKHRASDRKVRKGGGINAPSRDISLEIASIALERIGSPVALSVYLLLKYNEHRQIAEKAIDPLDYNSVESFTNDYLAVNILRKASHLNTGIDLEEAAISNFLKVEAHVGEVNRRLIKNRWFPKGDTKLSCLISKARTICHAVLGHSPRLSKLPGYMEFGPGSSSSCSRRRGNAYYKSSARLDVSPQLAPSAHLIVNAMHPWPAAALNADGPVSLLPNKVEVIRGARIECVPKDAKTHRVIAVEPHINIVLQKGIDRLMQDRIKRYGMDLSDQSRNQKLAELGFSKGYATIDLSNASDCVSLELVRELLPPKWFSLLDLARSHTVQVEGNWQRLEKFSTAGCGFTFPLETLVFYCIARAATGAPPLAVYGDDIIVHNAHYDSVVEALASVGFSVNSRKSFSGNHPFRESCGEDFFLGCGVRPFFIRGPVKTLSARISLHNQVMRYTLRRMSLDPGYDSLSDVMRKLRNRSRLLVPYDLGDAGFASSISDARRLGAHVQPLSSVRDGEGQVSPWYEGYMVRGLLQRPYRREMRQYYAALYHSFTTIASRDADSASEGFVLDGTKVSWCIAAIPVRGWFATDSFEILRLPDLG